MRAVLQRVSNAAVEVDGEIVAQIGTGLLALVAFTATDTERELLWMANKIRTIRIFPDAAGRMNRSVEEINGGILVVSQFTLYGELRKGTRPNFIRAAPAAQAERLYQRFLQILREHTHCTVASGVFGALMNVSLTNAGPVTILLEREAPGDAENL